MRNKDNIKRRRTNETLSDPAALLTLLVSMAALPATSLAEETVELTFYYPVGVGGDLALLIETWRRNLPRKIPTSSLTRFSAETPLKPPPRPSRPFRAGNAPDFAILGNSELYSMLSLDAIIPLDDLIAADEDGQEVH